MDESPTEITPVLNFASSQLAPRAPTKPEFLHDLECTMALLIFPKDKLTPELKELLEPALRQRIADRVNATILESLGAKREARIRGLVCLRAWADQKSLESKKDLPNLTLGLDSDPEHDDEDDIAMRNHDGDDTNGMEL
jgi:glucose-induced degradation protein 8